MESRWKPLFALVFLLSSIPGCAENPISPELHIEQRNPENGFPRILTYLIVRPIDYIEIQRDGTRYGLVPASGRARVVVHMEHVCVVCIRGIDELGNVDGAWVCIRSRLEVEDVY